MIGRSFRLICSKETANLLKDRDAKSQVENLMKAITLPTRLNMFVTSVWDAMVQEDKRSPGLRSGKSTSQNQRNRPQRKDFSYYMLVIDAESKEIVGHLADISTGGFKLDAQKSVPVNKNFRFLMNLPSEVASKPFMVFGARSRWCQVDPLDPCAYNVGYQLTHIFPEDLEIINRMMEKYGKDYEKKTIDLRRSYKW